MSFLVPEPSYPGFVRGCGSSLPKKEESGVLQWLCDTLHRADRAIKGPEFKLSYQQEDIQDPYDKKCLIRMAKQFTGMFMDHHCVTFGGLFLDNIPNFNCSTATDEELLRTLRRLLKYIMGISQLPLRLLATQHKKHYFGRQPASE